MGSCLGTLWTCWHISYLEVHFVMCIYLWHLFRVTVPKLQSFQLWCSWQIYSSNILAVLRLWNIRYSEERSWRIFSGLFWWCYVSSNNKNVIGCVYWKWIECDAVLWWNNLEWRLRRRQAHSCSTVKNRQLVHHKFTPYQTRYHQLLSLRVTVQNQMLTLLKIMLFFCH